MKKILVTGGTGLVGSAIKEISNSYEYHFLFLGSVDCDLLNYNQTNLFFEIHKPDYVIHLAANVGGLYKNMQQSVQMLEDNVIINTNVLKCAHKHGVKRLIACLSTCIFPDAIEYPIDETKLHNGPPHSSNAEYSHAKRLLEVQCNAYNKQFGLDYTCIIPTNVYGPNDNYNIKDSHVIPALIHKCYLSKIMNGPFLVNGTGKPQRQFIYSIDLAKLILSLLELQGVGSIILSPKEEYSIEHIANLIAKLMDYEGGVYFDSSLSDGQFKKTADNSKMAGMFTDFTFTPLEEGLLNTIQHFITNYKTIRK